MKRTWLFSALILALSTGFWPVPLAAQAQQPPPEDEAAPAQDSGSEKLDGLLEQGAQADDLDEIDAILNQDSAVQAGGGATYDPGDRRDPFKSLVQKRTAQRPSGPRPQGKAGLLIDEIVITGVFHTPEGDFAMVKGGIKEKSYLLQVGDQLYDGDVIRVDTDDVVFKQMINDPAAIKPFREVTKSLTEN